MSDPGRYDIETVEQLRAIIGEPLPVIPLKVDASLNEYARAFIARSPFLVMSTADAEGWPDASPKGDAPGFVRILDDRHLVIPDRPGNKRLDGMRNLLQNPHVGLIFLIPGREETLRVNGRAWIVRDEATLDPLVVQGKRPLVAIGVEVEECFFHCPKAFRRSRLWEPGEWPDRAVLPSMARVLYDKLRPAGKTLEEYERESEEGLRRTLY